MSHVRLKRSVFTAKEYEKYKSAVKRSKVSNKKKAQYLKSAAIFYSTQRKFQKG